MKHTIKFSVSLKVMLAIKLWERLGKRKSTFLLSQLIPIILCGCSSNNLHENTDITITPTPTIAVNKFDHDFGQVEPDSTSSCFFEISNSGGIPLVIGEVKTSCGCTVANLDSKEIAPGQTTKLLVDFTAGNSPGLTTKSIRINSNDPDYPEIQLKLSATVLPHKPIVENAITPISKNSNQKNIDSTPNDYSNLKRSIMNMKNH